jgi:O-antigen/teichoic acid export membrane protein
MLRILRGETAVVMGGQIVQLVVGVATSTLIARMLNADGYGIVNLLRTILIMVATVSPLGLDAALLKYCGRGDADDPRKTAVILQLRLIAFAASSAVVLAIGLCATLGLFSGIYRFAEIDSLFFVTFLALPFATDIGILVAVYRAKGRARRYAIIGPYLQSALRLALVPLAAVFSPHVETIVWINTAQYAMTAVLLMIDMRRGDRVGPPQAPAPADVAHGGAGEVLRESVWMCSSLFIYSLMRSADIMFLGASASAASVGEYAALAMVAQLIAVFPIAASQSLGPNISRAYHLGDHAGVKKELDRYLQKAAPVSAFIFGGVAVFGQRLDLVFGQSFHFGPAICLLLPLGQVLSATLAPMGFALSMTGRHRAENAILMVGGVILIALCALLVPAYGAVAAAASVAFTFFCVNVMRFVMVVRVIGATPGRWLDLAPAPLALALAALSKYFGDVIGGRDLPTTFFACCVYSLLFALSAFGLFMDQSVRLKLAQALRLQGAA